MPNPAVIGLDIAQNVFQVRGADAEGRCVLRRRLAAPRSSGSLPDCPKLWSESRHARAAIIGRVNFAAWATTSA
jgi:hypothetical protein